MITKNWETLNNDCPIDLERIKIYSREFDSNIPNKITMQNLDKSKSAVLDARANFDSMITTLVQVLHNREILKEKQDNILFAWLIDNLGRYMKKLDEEEHNLIIKFDSPDISESEVGIARISAYSKLLVNSCDTIIYESLLKATNEYNGFKDTDKLKKTPRIFLYMLFEVLQVTMAVLGGLTREKTTITKKGMAQGIPLSWGGLISPKGEKFIEEGFKEDTGVDISKFGEDIEELKEGELEILGNGDDDDNDGDGE